MKDDQNKNMLESSTIGKVKDNKYSFLSIIIIIVIFAAVIFILPSSDGIYNTYVKPYVDMYMGGSSTSNNNKNTLVKVDNTTVVDNDKKEEDKTDVNIDENGHEYIVCSNDNESIKYVFDDNKLIKIEDTISLTLLSESYQEYQNYYNLANDEEVSGLTVLFDKKDEVIKFFLTIDYTSLNTSLDKDLFFSKDKDLESINTYLTNKNYTCN